MIIQFAGGRRRRPRIRAQIGQAAASLSGPCAGRNSA